MSNALTFTRPTPDDKVIGISDANKPQGWISPNDVGAIAATVLTDDIEKHGDYVYELVGDAVTSIEQAQIFSNMMGRKITYQRISALDRYNYFISLGLFTHQFAYNLVSVDLEEPAVSQGIPILLGREPETLEQFVTLNKNLL
jgi:uncharacterized protein YbjT (DUF2867 family)